MIAYVISRVWQSVVVLAAMATITFVGVYAIGSPIDSLVPPEADQMERARVIKTLGLDLPLNEQFIIFLGKVLQGDFGRSFIHNVPALELIVSRLPATFELALSALVLALVIGLPLGMLAGFLPERPVGRTIMTGSILGFSLPNFWVGLMLIFAFSVTLQWLPAGGRGPTATLLGMKFSLLTLEGLKHLILPALTLAMFKISLVIRLAASATREALMQDYVKFARAKGLSWPRIIGVHVLKSISIPIITVLGIEFGSMLAFAVVTETVFAWPGMGKLLIDSIARLDRPVIVAYLAIIVFIFVVINFVVDILYFLIDPRIRVAGGEK